MYQRFFKRVFDLLGSVIGLIPLAIIFIPIALAIWFEDHGSIFYNAPRLGKNQKTFKMFKFRSMIESAPDIRNADGTTYNASDDFRVTKVGKFLRKTSLDELPQLLNVLRGDMSFVGPRPSPLGDKSKYPPEFFTKFEVKPGITGYNQATLRNQAEMSERIANDAYYVENVSFLLDIKILFKTFLSVIQRKNIHRNT